jgi:molybdopterin-guanine dinucleotide biosynthesis adapter protein
VLLMGRSRWALMHELRGDAEPPLAYLLSRLQDCDLALVEGFKAGDFPKLEVWRASVGQPMLWPRWPGIVAVASDGPPPAEAAGVTWLPLTDATALADLAWAQAATVQPRAPDIA